MATAALYIIILLFSLFFLFASQACSRTVLHGASLKERHEEWMAQHGRKYANPNEKHARFLIFKENVEYIESINRDGRKSHKLEINKFADLTNQEFQAARNGYKKVSVTSRLSKSSASFMYQNLTEVPPTVDWRKRGAVTPIKDQGECGCCWAFSAVAAMEGLHHLKTGNLISLSEQQLLDCDTTEDQGCQGGLMDNAFEFTIQNKGITAESNYPYKAIHSTCNLINKPSPAVKITGYENVLADSESSLLRAVANQPISAAIDAGGSDFQFYRSGVFRGPCGNQVNHGVTVVGYGEESDGSKYWVVKNSWGSSWGEEGYVRMERGKGGEGLCGIAKEASYPTA